MRQELLWVFGVGEVLSFKNETGDSVTITFPETSHLGPSRGSVRSFAESSHAKLGDQLCLILDRSEMSATAIVTDVTQHEAGWALVARLTGIEVSSEMKGLAASLDCTEGEVRGPAQIEGRRGCSPGNSGGGIPTSSGLDEALSRLETQLQQT